MVTYAVLSTSRLKIASSNSVRISKISFGSFQQRFNYLSQVRHLRPTTPACTTFLNKCQNCSLGPGDMTFVLYDLFSLHLWEELFFFCGFSKFFPILDHMRAKFWVTTVCKCLKVLKMNSVWSKMGRQEQTSPLQVATKVIFKLCMREKRIMDVQVVVKAFFYKKKKN